MALVGYWIKFLLKLFEKHPFIFIKLFIHIALQRSINFNVNNFTSILNYELVRDVLNRILSLLQRKTLMKTKSFTLKRLKRHYSTVRSMKNVAVFTEDGAFALFFRPHLGGFDSSRVPTPGNLPSKAKKSWNWLMHYNVNHAFLVHVDQLFQLWFMISACKTLKLTCISWK